MSMYFMFYTNVKLDSVSRQLLFAFFHVTFFNYIYVLLEVLSCDSV